MTTLTKSLKAILLIAITLTGASCKKDNDIPDSPESVEDNKYLSISATLESSGNDDKPVWAEGESILVMSSSGSFIEFKLTSGAKTSKAIFTSTKPDIKAQKVAVRGCAAIPKLDGNKLQINIPAESVHKQDRTDVPMIASIKGETTTDLVFKHIGTLIEISCHDIPDEATCVKLHSEHYRLNGDFIIEDITAENAVLKAEKAQGDKEKSLSMSFPSECKSAKVFFLIPTGGLEQESVLDDLSVELTDKSGTTFIKQPLETLEFARGTINSINLSAPATTYYQVPSDGLHGWDDGVLAYNRDTREALYIVYKKNAQDSTSILFLGINGEDDPKQGMTMHYSSGGQLRTMAIGDAFLEFDYGDEQVNAIIWDADGQCSALAFDYQSGTNTTRGILGDFMKLAKSIDYEQLTNALINIRTGFEYTEYLTNGEFDNLLRDFSIGLMADGAVGIFDLAGIPQIASTAIAAEVIGSFLDDIYEHDKKLLMGDAEVKIEQIVRESKASIRVDVSVSNAASIKPRYLTVKDKAATWEENQVLVGVAGSRSEGQLGYYVNSFKSAPAPIDPDKGDNQSFSFWFFPNNGSGGEFHFRPFLIPKHKSEPRDAFDRIYTLIRYGETVSHYFMDVNLDGFKQLSCVRNKDGKYEVKFSIKGEIPGTTHDMTSWGINISSKSQTGSLYDLTVSGYPPETLKAFNADITLNESDFVIKDGEEIAEIRIKPFVESALGEREYFGEEYFPVSKGQTEVKGTIGAFTPKSEYSWVYGFMGCDKNGNNVNGFEFLGSLAATIEHYDDLEEWGVFSDQSSDYDYYGGSYLKRRYSHAQSKGRKETITISITHPIDRGYVIDATNFEVTSTEKIGLYAKLKKKVFISENEYRDTVITYHGETEDIDCVLYNQKPSMRFIDASVSNTEVEENYN